MLLKFCGFKEQDSKLLNQCFEIGLDFAGLNYMQVSKRFQAKEKIKKILTKLNPNFINKIVLLIAFTEINDNFLMELKQFSRLGIKNFQIYKLTLNKKNIIPASLDEDKLIKYNLSNLNSKYFKSFDADYVSLLGDDFCFYKELADYIILDAKLSGGEASIQDVYATTKLIEKYTFLNVFAKKNKLMIAGGFDYELIKANQDNFNGFDLASGVEDQNQNKSSKKCLEILRAFKHL